MRFSRLVLLLISMVIILSYGGNVLSARGKASPEPSSTSKSLSNNNGFYAGLLMPGASLGYRYGGFRLESRFYSGDDFQMLGGRLACDFYTEHDFSFYTGLEAYQTEFEGLITEGEGLLYGTMLGLQYFIGDNLGFEVDYVLGRSELRDSYSSVETGELVHYMNLGVSYHL